MRDPQFRLKLARSDAEIAAAQRLRYKVFVSELGGGGSAVDHAAEREADMFDPFNDHLVLSDMSRPEAEQVVGVYRLMREDQARQAGRFYTEAEYDIDVLRGSGRRLLELGRSCLHPEYRGGNAMYHLWSGLADYVERHGIDLMFGVGSFHGTDPMSLAAPLSALHHRHLAPPDLRATVRAPHGVEMDLLPPHGYDRVAAMRAVPAIIKGYLRLGGHVGQGAFVDRAFNTTDVFVVLDTARMNARQRMIYTGARG